MTEDLMSPSAHRLECGNHSRPLAQAQPIRKVKFLGFSSPLGSRKTRRHVNVAFHLDFFDHFPESHENLVRSSMSLLDIRNEHRADSILGVVLGELRRRSPRSIAMDLGTGEGGILGRELARIRDNLLIRLIE